MEVKDIIAKLTIEEKAALLSGQNEWESWDIPRVGIGTITFSDGPHGLRRQEGAGDHLGLNASLPATCFPTAATVANSWDTDLGEKIGQALGEEALAQGVNVILGPGINMKRSPLCGRNFEYFSEDPILAGKMAAAYVRGIQSRHVYACPKHFAVNSREYRRMATNAVVDERTLREIYLTAFEIAVKEGKTKALMTAYNEVNGSYANENEHLLNDILRNEWKFDGLVVTDWGGSNDHTAGVKCQSNMEMPNPGLDSARGLLKDLEAGRITEAEINRAIEPVIEAALYFQKNQAEEFDQETHHQLARQAAAESSVLLKNEGNILPLKAGTKVALRGPFVENPRYQGAGSSQVNATRVETIAEEIKKYDLVVTDDPAEADVILFFFGLDPIAESEGADRIAMELPEYQIKELESLASQNPYVIGIMSAGSAITMPWLDHLTALLHGYLTGQAGASAILDLLTGRANPSGKLAESYPFSYEDCSIVNYANETGRNLLYKEGPFIGYRYYDTAETAVQFPFGYGLSYTTFSYDALTLNEDGVRFQITNSGNCAGAEIAQLYVGKKNSALIRPKKELKGFVKVYLEPGETKTVEIRFDDKTFSYFNTKTNRWEIEGGSYDIMIGASLIDIRLTAEAEKKGTTDILPYDISQLPSYQSGRIQNVSDAEFERLYGTSLPTETTGELQLNDALSQMKYAKNGICRLVYRVLQSKLDTAMKKGTPDLNTLFVYNMPFRAISKMTAGMVSREMAESIVTIANGHFFRGVGGVIGGFFRNRRENKKYETILKNGKTGGSR